MKQLLKVPVLRAGNRLACSLFVGAALMLTEGWTPDVARAQTAARERISLNADRRFMKYASRAEADHLIYDVRPEIRGGRDDGAADAKATEAADAAAEQSVLKPWILPTANDFIQDPANKHVRPAGDPGSDFPLVQRHFNDAAWEKVDLPHDWAIQGPFYQRKRNGVQNETGSGTFTDEG